MFDGIEIDRITEYGGVGLGTSAAPLAWAGLWAFFFFVHHSLIF